MLVAVALPGFAPIVLRCGLDARAVGGCSHAPLELSAQPAAPQRTPGDDAESFGLADRDKLPFQFAVQQVIERLQAREGLPTVRAAGIDGLLKLVSGEVAGSEVTHFAALHQTLERAESLFKRRHRVPAVDLIQVDVVRPQAAQAVFHTSQDMFTA